MRGCSHNDSNYCEENRETWKDSLSQHHIRQNVSLTQRKWSQRKQFSLTITAGMRLLCCWFWELKSFDCFGWFWAASHHLSKRLPHLTPFSLGSASPKHSCSNLTVFHPNSVKEDWLCVSVARNFFFFTHTCLKF